MSDYERPTSIIAFAPERRERLEEERRRAEGAGVRPMRFGHDRYVAEVIAFS